MNFDLMVKIMIFFIIYLADDDSVLFVYLMAAETAVSSLKNDVFI